MIEIRKGHLIKAREYLQKVNVKNSKSNSLRFNKALVLSSFGFFKKSQDLLDEIMEKNFSDNDVLFLAGHNYLNLGNSDMALNYLDRLSSVKKNNFDQGFTFARALFESRRDKEALTILSRLRVTNKMQKKKIEQLRGFYTSGRTQ